MNLNDIKPVTVAELLKWVRESKSEKFYYCNDSGERPNCGCLMTNHLKATIGGGLIVCCNGDVKEDAFGGRYSEHMVYPFHNDFWKPFRTGKGWPSEITKSQAIARLEEMLAAGVK
jgi:hypothetical protein